MRRIIAISLLIGLAFTETACVIVDPGPGPGRARWCYWHPYRCR